ncbi:pyridoxal-phosphate-dependent aminotransferase family protein [Devosia naphthalenivorans]|uniref:pyridoxal-phosphate-dependent aminotransferase family protein n=1 Tax=Devosia naphthalenivorans TaxID=2082392 RepID=UPI000D38A3B6|nr:aminotransferase class V-fold PLP-dependent enzyme [Devosia naphthalenivorans]
MNQHFGQHFLQIPGPSAVPDRVLRAISMPVIDHRGPEFADLANMVLAGIKRIFKTESPVLIFPGSGTGAWESAVVNLLAEGDRVLMVETGHFATQWRKLTEKMGIETEFIAGNWRNWADPEQIRARLAADTGHKIKAVMVVHNETSSGVVSPIKAIREAIDSEIHPALLLVDAISSLGSLNYEHDAWGADVTVTCSQKGLMLPPGLAFVALSPRAIEQARTGGSRRSYWDWAEMIELNRTGFFPYTPATNLLYGLKEAIALLEEEGLANVFARHDRLAAAARAAVRSWGLEILCENEAAHSSVLTAVVMPEGHDSDMFRRHVLAKYNLSLGQGLTRLKGKIFRIGHLGQCNELVLMGTLSGIEMGLRDLQVPHVSRGVSAAMSCL